MKLTSFRRPSESTHRFGLYLRRPGSPRCAVLDHQPVQRVNYNHRGKDTFIEPSFVACRRCDARPVSPFPTGGFSVAQNSSAGQVPGAKPGYHLFTTMEQYDAATVQGWVTWRAVGENEISVELSRSKWCLSRFTLNASIGTPGSETPLDIRIGLPWVGAAYISANGPRFIRAWAQARYDRNRDWDNAEVGITIDREFLTWRLGVCPMGSSYRTAASWRQGFHRWEDILFGRETVERIDVAFGGSTADLPEGRYITTVVAQTTTRTRARRRTRVEHTYDVEFTPPVTYGPNANGDVRNTDEVTVPGVALADPHGPDRTWVDDASRAAAVAVLMRRAERTGDPLWAPAEAGAGR